MKTYETSVQLSLKSVNSTIYLVVAIKLPQFSGKKLTAPQNHIFDGGDKSKIKFIFTETDANPTEAAPPGHLQKTYEVEIGKCSSNDTSSQPRNLGNCASATQNQPNAILSKYNVNVQVNNSGGRNTTTYISDDADIDLFKGDTVE